MKTHAIRSLSVLSLCLAVGFATSCGGRAEGGEGGVVQVTDWDIGRSLKADGTIDDNTTNFRPSDIVYVSVGTKGTGTGTVQVRWLYGEEREITSQSKEVGPNDRRVTFQLSDANGLAKGEYKVELNLNGVAQGPKRFSVD